MDRYQVAARPWAGSSENVNDILWTTYRWMSVGLAITGMVAWVVSQTPAAIEMVIGNRIAFYVLLFAQLGLVMAFSSLVTRVSTAAAAAMFFTYAAITGLTFSVLFLVYTQASIAQTFFITSGSFAGLSVLGATTKRDLSAVGRFGFFAVIGIVIASVVNMFLHSPALMWFTSIIGVVVFAGLTAYDTQKLKEMYASQGGAGNLALRGALMLYLDFINMFIFLLNLTGRRK